MKTEAGAESFERMPFPGIYSPIVEGIKANAEAVIEELAHLTDFEFGYHRESVAWLEGYIERMKQAGVFNGPGRDKLVSVFGSFLGECIIRVCGGSWKQRDGAWGVAFDEEQFVQPFAAVAAQVDRGRACGIRSFFDLVPITFIGCTAGRSATITRKAPPAVPAP
jgi:hypothetical protein